MFQVRFHGRGGQGVVTAAELLAEAAFREGRHAQAFPSFGSACASPNAPAAPSRWSPNWLRRTAHSSARFSEPKAFLSSVADHGVAEFLLVLHRQ